jgi:hypothetical protein
MFTVLTCEGVLGHFVCSVPTTYDGMACCESVRVRGCTVWAGREPPLQMLWEEGWCCRACHRDGIIISYILSDVIMACVSCQVHCACSSISTLVVQKSITAPVHW